MLRDFREHAVTAQQHCIEIEGALRNVRVGNCHVDALAREQATEIAHFDPVAEVGRVSFHVLKELTDHALRVGRVSTGMSSATTIGGITSTSSISERQTDAAATPAR